MYEVGKVYIWQNMRKTLASLNGTECTVIGAPKQYKDPDGTLFIGQATDAVHPLVERLGVAATYGTLRPKNPPAGERFIMGLFHSTPTATHESVLTFQNGGWVLVSSGWAC